MLEDLPLNVPLEESLNSAMGYLAEHVPRVKSWFDVLINPLLPLKHHHLFFYNDGPDAFICFLVSREATFLPDWLSKIIQLYGGVHVTENTLNLYSYQQTLYQLLGVFIRLCEFRIAMNFWIIINPYTQPWVLVLVMTEWFLESLSGLFPLFFGIDFTGVIVISVIAQFADYIKNLVFTMPYLPSEAIQETIGSHQIYKFAGFPRLWYEYGIPDQLREEWYTQKPEIIEHFLKYYSGIDQDILPTRLLKEYYENHVHNITINMDLNTFSTGALSYINDISHMNILTNHIETLSEKLIIHIYCT